MANLPNNYSSALAGHYHRGAFGAAYVGAAPVSLSEIHAMRLHQIAAWPQTMDLVAAQAAQAAGVTAAPPAGTAAASASAALLRIEPLKWWLVGRQESTHKSTWGSAEAPLKLPAEHGAVLDLSDSRVQVRITGAQAAALLNRHLPLDLRAAAFPRGAVAGSALHHVGITLWHSADGYELFIPRGFALFVWQMLLRSAAPFGAEIV